MSRFLYRLGKFAARRPWTVIGMWLAAAVVVVGASTMFGQTLEDEFEVPGVDSHQATELLAAAGSDREGPTARVVATPLQDGATFFSSSAARRSLAELQSVVNALPNVLGTSDPTAASVAGPTSADADGSLSADGRVALISVQYAPLDQLTATDLENLKEVGAELSDGSPLRVEMGGDLFFSFEEAETGAAEMVGVIAAIIILLVAFGSVVAMGLPIGIALFGLALGISSMALVSYLVEIPSWAPEVGAMVGLGVGIDYALFLVTRHRELLSQGLEVEEAIGRAAATAGKAVVFAGGTVVVAILGLAVAGVPFVTAAGIAISVIVLIMVIASITLLPAFLGVAGPRIDRFSLRRTPISSPGAGPRWERWGAHVTAHAKAYAAGSAIILVALAAPVLALEVGFIDDGSLSENRTERQAYELVADGFEAGANGPLVVAVDISEDPGAAGPLRDAIAADDGIARVAPAQVNTEAGVATLLAVPTTAPRDQETVATVSRLREEVIPSALGDSPARAHVGGQTASVADVSDRVSDRLPYFIGAVILLSFLLLVVLFRSVLVPLKAAVLNLLSIGAAYGVLVMVFQWGWGLSLIGLDSTVPIVSFIPMFLFAILFGLSMDYEVFLLSRIRERYMAGDSNERSVIHGIAATARVITAAALIMISVFMGFVLSDDPVVKMWGLGLATAILVDATLVRLVLVPATMKLMGDANWWLPAWLDRRLPHVDADGIGSDLADELDRPHDGALV